MHEVSGSRHRLGRATIIALLGAVFALAALPAAAAPGELDASFGIDGTGRTNLGGTYDWAYATALQPDGKILAAGVSNAEGTYDFAVARYNPDQSLDPSFGEGGVVTTDLGGSYDWAYALAIQPDGGFLVAGTSDAGGSRDFAVARYTSNGSLDAGFGKGGVVIESPRPLSNDVVRAIGIQPDGKIVASGVTFDDEVTLRSHGDFMVARYTADGQRDPTFGVGGLITTNFEGESYDEPYAMAILPDGKILLGGYSNSGGGVGVIYGADNVALARYLPNGILDSTFGTGGKSTLDLGTLDEEIRDLVVAPDGKILTVGFVDGEKRGDLLVSRFNENGTIDPSFGNQGSTISNLGTNAERFDAIALQPDGRIVAAGLTAHQAHADFAVARYEPNGAVDPSFGTGGLVTADFGGREDRAHAVTLQPDGRIVAVGQSEADFALARFTGDS